MFSAHITAAAVEAESRVLMSSCSNLTLRTITDPLFGRRGSGVIQYFVENLFLYRMRTQGCRESLHFMNFIELD